ncbi:upstream activation factor subunit spp27 [Bradysia coprophila]|uniref:upstream activation factor subunit spp27 n=1 Tax=Bradysia coprophila TaxID=38358 RepID=UPI00187D7F2B|nr:upstream activation factor subunit spp27 [Bradysia coprophila]
MEKITTEILRKEIHEILKDADLTDMSSKKVRTQIEQKLNCDLLSRKKEIDNMVMDYVNSKANSDEDSDADSDESADDPKPVKRPAPAKSNSTAKKQKVDSDDGASKDDDSDDDFKSSRRQSSRGGKKKASEKSTKKPRVKKDGEKRKGGGYTRPLKLSPALSALLGTEAAPRHEVVAKVWAIIKERNLYDPKNRQYAICDTELRKVMGIKRFRTFGMLKYLKNHFLE